LKMQDLSLAFEMTNERVMSFHTLWRSE
jgi:hypothetical protein